LDQWVERLATFLDLPPKSVGRLGGGRNKPTGLLDVAVIQSLIRKDVVNDCVANYGHVIVDECHHLSAHSFEQVVRRAKARFILGLSATVTRKDGHHPIIFMQCGDSAIVELAQNRDGLDPCPQGRTPKSSLTSSRRNRGPRIPA
jgi:superfamily II DNA or RNA helicase